MFKIRYIFLATMILLLLADPLFAAVPMCEDPPTFTEARHFEGTDSSRLPERVFVARTVEVWAANKEKGLKLLARHNFKSMKSEVRCSKPPYEGSLNLEAFVPALLDLSPEKKWGDSVWQVHALVEEKRVGIWSQKSRLAPTNTARKIMQKGFWRPLDNDAYELIWDQESNGTHYTFRIEFDVMSP